VDAALASDVRRALDPKVSAALAFIETLVRTPERVGEADVEALRAAGLTDDAIEDAAFVCALFTTYVRLADTFEFDVPPGQVFEQSAKMLLKVGYAFPPPLAWLARRDNDF
jgi:alkylhydroperoxidase family enzyme